MKQPQTISVDTLFDNDNVLLSMAKIIAQCFTNMTSNEINNLGEVVFIDADQISEDLVISCYNNSIKEELLLDKIKYEFNDGSFIKLSIY